MEPSNYGNLQEILESSKSNLIPNENDPNSLKVNLDLFNTAKEEKKSEKSNNSENNSEKSTESNKDGEKDKNGKEICQSKKNSKITNKKGGVKINKKFSLGRKDIACKKKTIKIEIQDMTFLFGEKALNMFELLDIINIKKSKTKSGSFEVFMRKKHMKVFLEYPFFKNEKGIINSENSNIFYPEDVLDEGFNEPFMNIEDNIFGGNNIHNNDEDIIHFENIANINVNQPVYNRMPSEVLNNPSEQLGMILPNGNLTMNSSSSVDETDTNIT